MPDYHVFFSHGSEDGYIVNNHLRKDIEGTGATVFVDKGHVEYGDDFRKTILEHLGACDEFLALLTATSISRVWVAAEIGAALMRGVRVVVVNYGVSPNTLAASGILSLIGTTKVLTMDEFPNYLAQLRARVVKNGGTNV